MKISVRDLILATAIITAGIHANPNTETLGGPYSTFLSTYDELCSAIDFLNIKVEDD